MLVTGVVDSGSFDFRGIVPGGFPYC